MENNKCCICYENIKIRVILSCGHMEYCYECVKKIDKNNIIRCALCRNENITTLTNSIKLIDNNKFSIKVDECNFNIYYDNCLITTIKLFKNYFYDFNNKIFNDDYLIFINNIH